MKYKFDKLTLHSHYDPNDRKMDKVVGILLGLLIFSVVFYGSILWIMWHYFSPIIKLIYK